VAGNIFFDLDGTLFDSRARVHALFCRLLGECAPGTVSPGFDEYWRLKRTNYRQAPLLAERYGFTPEMIATFRREWMARIEDPELLELDVPLVGVGALLERLSAEHALHVVTGRQHPERAAAQLEALGWSRHLSSLLATRQTVRKADLVRASVQGIGPQDMFVGDTGEDILAARELGVVAVAVLSGFLGCEALRNYGPDRIVESVEEAFPDLTPRGDHG
jgi:phosphoglycolate phosphatase